LFLERAVSVKGLKMLQFRWYNILCPACRRPIDILPPQSLVAEDCGLAHQCPGCRKWLATYVRRAGSARHPELRVIESRVEPIDLLFLGRRMVG
jgi:hypothetical protein